VKVFAPAEIIKYIKLYSTSAAQLNNCSDDIDPKDPSQSMILLPADIDIEYKVYAEKREFLMKCIKCHHTVPSIGYTFSEIRKKLKDEFKDLPGKEIGKLAKEGKDIYTYLRTPLFAFLGDTTTKVFETSKELFDYPVVIVECTLFEDEHYSASQFGGHTHWKDLSTYVTSHPKTIFVLIHFSMRYRKSEIIEFFKPIQETLKNIVVLVDKPENC